MRIRKRRAFSSDADGITVYYASDVHGSERCWRKFLGAGRFYGAQVLIMGGDLMGKAIVPITRERDGHFSATFLGERHEGDGGEQLEQLVEAVRYNGMYPWLATTEDVSYAARDAATRDHLFDRVMLDELRRWIALADERMASYGIEVFVMPGNDDPWICDDVIEEASWVKACDDRVVRVGPHEMISCAYANPTPWRSPRELSEEALYARIKTLADAVENPGSAIFNLHVPPYDSGLDTAAEVRDDLTVVYSGGKPREIPVGSHAVRQILEEYQPMLALHGHIHESRGEVRIGRTLVINSGSEYNSGRLHGVIAKLNVERVVSHQFVVG